MDISIIKDIRETYNLTREEFAEKLDINLDTLNTWEYRNKKIPAKKILNIEKVFSAYFNGEEISKILENNYILIEYYDLQNVTGKIEFGKLAILTDNKKRLIPRQNDNGNYLVVSINGHSMDDNTKRSISDGDEIFIREFTADLTKLPIHSKLFIIVTNNGAIIRQVLENDNQQIKCHSFNSNYKDFLIVYSDILQIFTVEYKVHSNIIF